MNILYILLILLIITRLAGELAERLNQPALLGELVSGIFLGLIIHQYPDVFPVFSALPQNEVFNAITELGIFFLLLMGGIELRPSELADASKNAFIIALGGMLLPFFLGLGLGWFWFPESNLKIPQAFFLGTCLGVTAVPVAIKVLMDLGKVNSRVGNTIVSAAVVDDLLSLVLLAILTSFLQTGAMPGMGMLAWLILKILIFFVLTFCIGHYAFPYIGRWLKTSRAEEFELSMLLVGALAYAMLAEWLGMHFILGAFVAGLFFRRRTIDKKTFRDIQSKIQGVTTGFLAPVFFASIGLHLDLAALTHIPIFVILLILVASVGKVVGSGGLAMLVGMTKKESLGIGIAMNARGAVELVVADIALKAGLFEQPDHPTIRYLFSAVVIMALVTTLMTPLCLKKMYGGKKKTR